MNSKILQTMVLALMLALHFVGAPRVLAQNLPAGAPPYEEDLNRLAEILGALHHLRGICGADEGDLWRQKMQALLNTEAQTDARRARLTDSFNRGYRGYRNAYKICDEVAVFIIDGFVKEGAEIASRIAARYGT